MLGFSFNDHHNSGMFFLDHLEDQDTSGYHFNMGDTPLGETGSGSELIIGKESISFSSHGEIDFAFHNEADCGDELLRLQTTERDIKTISKVDIEIEHNSHAYRNIEVDHTATCDEDHLGRHRVKNWF